MINCIINLCITYDMVTNFDSLRAKMQTLDRDEISCFFIEMSMGAENKLV